MILGGKGAQAGIKRDRSGLVENTVPFDIRKFKKFKPGILVEWNAPPVFRGMLVDPGLLKRSPELNSPWAIQLSSSETQGLLAGTMQYFEVKVYFKS